MTFPCVNKMGNRKEGRLGLKESMTNYGKYAKLVQH